MRDFKEYDGELQEFADYVFKTKKATGMIKTIGKLDPVVVDDLKQKGITPDTNSIIINDRKILKYVDHPKGSKGATIDKNRFNEIVSGINNPTAIYEDLNSKSIVYAYASKYDNKMLKLIVQPNYHLQSQVVNLLKSIGIVDIADLENQNQYKKIKGY